jgi:hypothetical protein
VDNNDLEIIARFDSLCAIHGENDAIVWKKVSSIDNNSYKEEDNSDVIYYG